MTTDQDLETVRAALEARGRSGLAGVATRELEALSRLEQRLRETDDLRKQLTESQERLLAHQTARLVSDARIGELEAALGWYADTENYVPRRANAFVPRVRQDTGKRARSALSQETVE